MTDEVKVIHIGHPLIRFQQFQINAPLPEQIPNLLLFFLGTPLADEVVQRRILSTDILLGVVHNALLSKQFPIGVVDGDRLMDNLHLAAIAIHDGLGTLRRRVTTRGISCTIRRSRRFRTSCTKARVHLNGAVPLRVGEQPRYIAEIHHNKMGLSILLPQAGAAPDDLLKLSHRANHLIQNDQLGHLTVGPGREQFRSSCNDRILGRHRDKIAQFLFAILIAAGNAHHIIRVLLDHVRIQIDQRPPHPLSGIFRCAEHNRLGHTIGAFQVACDFGSYLLNAVFDDNVIVVVAVGINPIRDLIAVDVPLSLSGTPAIANVRHDIDHLEGRKKSILNAFLQAVCIDRLPEIVQIGNILGFLGGGRHTDLGGRLEIFQNPAPAAFLFSRASVTLIHNDQIKEIRLKQFTKMLLIVIPYKLLIQREIHLVGGNGTWIILCHIDFVNRLFQWSKVLHDGLIHQNIAICQIEHLSLHSTFQQAVDDLKCGIGFSSTGGHDQQQSLLAAGDGIYCAVDGDPLVIPGRIGILAGIVRLVDRNFLGARQTGFFFIACNEFRFCGEFIQTKLPLCPRKKIVLGKPVSVGAERKRQIQHFGILHRLLKAMRNTVVVVFRLNHRNGVVGAQI